MRSGVGLLTVHVPKCGYEIIQTSVPEAMVSVDESENSFFHLCPKLESFNAIGIGPGLGQDKQTVKALTKLARNSWDNPVVLDADALNILGSK
jgi:NAD(P)H-hydrate repair Nnr-like enzyme with NAD(P)H-hydrate dehydratase domain